jgi:hypothetical protein
MLPAFEIPELASLCDMDLISSEKGVKYWTEQLESPDKIRIVLENRLAATANQVFSILAEVV